MQANGKQPVTCSKCGFVGGNVRGCGTAHEPLVAAAHVEILKSTLGEQLASMLSPPPSRAVAKPAVVRELARDRRAAAIAARAERSASFVRPKRGAPSDDASESDGADEVTDLEHPPRLPEPVASFEF